MSPELTFAVILQMLATGAVFTGLAAWAAWTIKQRRTTRALDLEFEVPEDVTLWFADGSFLRVDVRYVKTEDGIRYWDLDYTPDNRRIMKVTVHRWPAKTAIAFPETAMPVQVRER